MYRSFRPLLFRLDPEFVHHSTLTLLERAAGSEALLRALSSRFRIDDDRLAVECFGLRFPNPIGLAAGMDKDGRALPAWQALGFGFTEAGSVTDLPQPGNPRPRLFRLPSDQAIINRMGFNNEGAGELRARLNELRERGRLRNPVLVNVGKSRAAPLETAEEDYRRSLQRVWPHADGAVINVSSPNTPGLRSLQEPRELSRLLSVTDELQAERSLPVLLKLAPDLSDAQLEEIADLAGENRVAGLVAVNSTTSRSGLRRPLAQEGGLSGKPLAARSLAVLRLLSARTTLPIVSVGGIFTTGDVIERLRAGARLVELYTGFVYGGPGTVRRILEGVLEYLEREAIADVESLIGLDRS